MQILLSKTVQSISATMYIIYYSLRYYKKETQLVGLFFTKGVVELVVKEFLKCSGNSCKVEDISK